MGGKRARKKPRKKRRNAKARYDRQYPVVPIRLHKSLKKQFAKEAEKKGLMLSQYIRELLRGFEVRERIVEKVVEKPVVKTVTKTIVDPEREDAIRGLEERITELKEKLSSTQREFTKARERCAKQQGDISILEKSNIELREVHKELVAECEAKEKEAISMREEIKGMESSLRSASREHDVHMGKYQQLKAEIEDLTDERSRLDRQLQWAIGELRSNDERNEIIAKRMTQTYDIQVRFITAAWHEMPE